MAYRPFLTIAMERATRMTRIYGLLLLFFSALFYLAWYKTEASPEHLQHQFIGITLDMLLPGLTMCFLANRMGKTKLWAYIAEVALLGLMFFKFLLTFFGIIDSRLHMLNVCVLNIPLAFLIASLLNAMPNVLDAYRNHRHDRNLNKRGFEPILKTPPPTHMTLPPRPKQNRN